MDCRRKQLHKSEVQNPTIRQECETKKFKIYIDKKIQLSNLNNNGSQEIDVLS